MPKARDLCRDRPDSVHQDRLDKREPLSVQQSLLTSSTALPSGRHVSQTPSFLKFSFLFRLLSEERTKIANL